VQWVEDLGVGKVVVEHKGSGNIAVDTEIHRVIERAGNDS
jgi:endonuclease III